MKTFSTSLIAALVVGSLGLAGDALAGGGGGKKSGGFSIAFGGNGGGYGNLNNNHNNGNNQSCHSNNNGNGGCNSNPYDSNYGQAYEPFHSSYFVQPGDSFYQVSLKEYGSIVAMKYIARYNRLATNSALVPGQRLLLPSISPNGRLTASRAPAAEQFGAPQGPFTNPTAKFAQPISKSIASPAPVVSEPEQVSVPTGSVLKLDGEKLGSEAGVVRLRISNVAFPVEVIEWSADSTKIRLPKLDVTEATKAELEVVRADGSLASTNAIELTTAAGGLALGN